MSGCTISKGLFGTTKEKKDIESYTLKNSNNATVEIITFGAIIRKICIPNKNGQIEDICLGFDDIEGYESQSVYIGAIIGRVANRIANAKFTLDGETYMLKANSGPNTLHGGVRGFSQVIWKASIVGSVLCLKYISSDGEEGFPGQLTTWVTYELTNENTLVVDYKATTTKSTPVNLTNHAYFNLSEQGYGDVLDHMITIHADSYLPVDDTSIPTGEIASVTNTSLDLRQPVKLGERIFTVPGGKGFDHNLCVGENGKKKFIAKVAHPSNGRYMEVWTTLPGVQFYTSYYLNNVKGKGGSVYRPYTAFCLETQHYPNSINQVNFPNCVLRPGETYSHTTWYKFEVSS